MSAGQGALAVLCGWEGWALHRLCGISTYTVNVLHFSKEYGTLYFDLLMTEDWLERNRRQW